MLTTEARTAAAMIAHTRERCEGDFRFFVRYFFKHRKGTKFIFNEHHEVICEDLMMVYQGVIMGYICNMPPRYGKTELIVIMFVLWCFVKNRRCEFIHLSYALSLVLENSDAIRTIIKSAEFKQLWPDFHTKDSKDAKSAWATQEGGSFLGTQAGGAITGFGAGRMDEWNPLTNVFTFSGAIVIDDPLKPDDARHDNMRKAINDRWHSTIKSRRNSPRTPVICVMQRLHEDDFTAELLRDDSMGWFHRKMQALVDEGTDSERALWPEKHTVAALKKMKAANQYHFAGQMQQMPSPLGGGILKGEWFGRYEILPKIKFRKIYVDTAQKTKEQHDYSVFAVYGMGEDGKIYLIDQIRGKWEAPDLLRKARDFWAKHKAMDVFKVGHLRQMRVEDKASGTGLIQQLKTDRKLPIPVFAQQRSTDKVIRAGDAAPYLEAGFVMIPANAPFVSDFVQEAEAFTTNDTHEHDDQLDPLFDAIADMLDGKNVVSLWEQMA